MKEGQGKEEQRKERREGRGGRKGGMVTQNTESNIYSNDRFYLFNFFYVCSAFV